MIEGASNAVPWKGNQRPSSPNPRPKPRSQRPNSLSENEARERAVQLILQAKGRVSRTIREIGAKRNNKIFETTSEIVKAPYPSLSGRATIESDGPNDDAQ